MTFRACPLVSRFFAFVDVLTMPFQADFVIIFVFVLIRLFDICRLGIFC